MKATLDTNVLARILVDDVSAPGQCASARKALAAAQWAFVPQAVQIELCWVLESAFGLRHGEIAAVLSLLQATPRVELEHRAAFDATLESFKSNPAWGFADCMIATAAAQHGAPLLTFDKKLARLAGASPLR